MEQRFVQARQEPQAARGFRILNSRNFDTTANTAPRGQR
jgi:hypothetical protein